MPSTEADRGQYRRAGLRLAVQRYFYGWHDSGRWQNIATALVECARCALGRTSKPTTAVFDSPSASTAHARWPRGYDTGKRVRGRKRHIVADSNGFLLAVHLHPANIQDCHGEVPLLRNRRGRVPKLRDVFADCIYRGPELLHARSDCGPWTIEIVEHPQGIEGFQVLPRCWVVERTFA